MFCHVRHQSYEKFIPHYGKINVHRCYELKIQHFSIFVEMSDFTHLLPSLVSSDN